MQTIEYDPLEKTIDVSKFMWKKNKYHLSNADKVNMFLDNIQKEYNIEKTEFMDLLKKYLQNN